MLRDGGTYVEMGQFTDAGAISTNWHRICTKDLNVLGSWAFTANDIPLGIAMLDRARERYPWYDMQTLFPFTEAGSPTPSQPRWRCARSSPRSCRSRILAELRRFRRWDRPQAACPPKVDCSGGRRRRSIWP
jgi:hypothetical protein